MVYNFFDKKSIGSGVNIPLKSNEQLAKKYANELLETLKKQQFALDLNTIIWVLI